MPDDPINWDEIIRNAQQATDQEFQSQISGLTRLTDPEIEKIIIDSGIGKKDLLEVIRIVKTTTGTNNAKAKAIGNINRGINVLVSLVSKLI